MSTQSINSSMNPLVYKESGFGLTCGYPACKQVLTFPIFSVDCPCNHAFHLRCITLFYYRKKDKYCPVCDFSFTKSVRNEKLERIARSLQKLSLSVLEKVSVPFVEKQTLSSQCAPGLFLWYMLKEAIEEEKFEVADYLSRDKNIFFLPKHNSSLLYVACQKADPKVVKRLLEQGRLHPSRNVLASFPERNHSWQSFNSYFKEGMLPIHLASQRGDLEIVRLLVQFGALIDEQDHFGRTALFHALLKKREEVALYLIDQGAFVYGTDSSDRSILSYAILSGLVEVVKKLVLEKGVALTLPYKREGSCIFDAMYVENEEMLRFLLDHGGKYMIQDGLYCSEFSPLSLAVKHGYFEHVKMLVEVGMDISYRGSREKTILQQAEYYLRWTEHLYAHPFCPELKEKERVIESRKNIYYFLKERLEVPREMICPNDPVSSAPTSGLVLDDHWVTTLIEEGPSAIFPSDEDFMDVS